MSEMQQQDSTPEQVVDTPEVPTQEQEVGTGTTETVAETDEQKNERAVQEREERARKRNDGIQRRFNELTAEKRQLMEQNARILSLLERQGQPQAPQAPKDAAPQREQFSDYESYVEARAAYAAEQKAAAKVSEFVRAIQAQDHQARTAQQTSQFVTKLQSDLVKVRQELPDYDDVVSNLDGIDAPPAMTQAILDSESPGRVFHVLGQNPDEARRIAALPPMAQIKAIAKIEAGLKPSTPQVSKAPAPGKPLGAKSGASAGDPPEDAESYMAWAAKHMR